MNLINLIKKVPQKIRYELEKIQSGNNTKNNHLPIRDANFKVETHSVGEVREYYEEMTDNYIQGFGEVFQGSRPDSTEELLDYILDAADIRDGMKVADAGCGVCGPSIWFARHRKIEIEALTISEKQVEEARKRIKLQNLDSQINVRQGDFHLLGEIYPHNYFDRIVFLETLCHAESYRQVLEQAKLVLKPGGSIYIKDFYCVDNRSKPHLLAGQQQDLNTLNKLYYLAIADIPSTVDLLCELGFEIVYMRQPNYIYSPKPWLDFEKHAGKGWNPVSGNPDTIIRAVEFYCLK